MYIKKITAGSGIPDNAVLDGYSTSQTDAYSCNYMNRTTNIYSIEKVIGYDELKSKPIYKKTWTGTITGSYSGSYYEYLSGISNAYEIIKAYGYISDTNNNGGNQFYLGYNAQDFRLVKLSDGRLRIDTTSSFYGKYFKITIEYTKSS